MKRVVKYQSDDGSLHENADDAAVSDLKHYLNTSIGNIAITNGLLDAIKQDVGLFKKIVDNL